jgi:hypothetical protein
VFVEWRSFTPDGQEVVVRREGDFWIVRCGHTRAQSTNLDVALTEALRSDLDVVAHARGVDYPTWIRRQADSILSAMPDREDRVRLPRIGDRIELVQATVSRGLVVYADQLQVLVKRDDGGSVSLRIGRDHFRILPPESPRNVGNEE